MRRVDSVSKEQTYSFSEEYWVNFIPRLHQKIFTEGVKKRENSFWQAPYFRFALGFAVIAIALFTAFVPYFSHRNSVAKVVTPGVYQTTADRNVRVKNYLTSSEIILIKLVAMPEQKEDLERLKGDIMQAGLVEQIDSNMEAFKDDPQLLTHSKAMEVISIKVLNADEKYCEEDLKQLKSQILKSGILEKTQSMKL
jgi:hypothetical protein